MMMNNKKIAKNSKFTCYFFGIIVQYTSKKQFMKYMQQENRKEEKYEQKMADISIRL